MRNKILYVFIVTLFKCSIFCSYDFDFLSFISGAKSSGLGGNLVTLYDTSEGLFYNPAISSFNNFYDISLSNQIFFGQDYINQLSLIIPNNNILSFGFAIKFLSTSDISLVRNNNIIGNYNLNSLLSCGSLSFLLSNNLSLGLGLKYVQEKFYTIEKSDLLYDIGLLFKTKDDLLSLGLSLENFGFSDKYKLPSNYNIGLGVNLGLPQQQIGFKLILSSKIDYHTKKPFYNLGIEHWLTEIVSVRIGYIYDEEKVKLGIFDNLSFMSIGFSFKIGNFVFDYAYNPNSVLGNSHSLGINFKFIKKEKIEKPVVYPKKPKKVELEKIEQPVELIVEPKYFSPNNDGYLDTITFKHNIDTFSYVDSFIYIIRDSKNNIVKSYTSNKEINNIQDTFFIFDGKDLMGKVLEDGKYSVEFSLIDIKKDKIVEYKSDKKYFAIDTKAPSFEINLSTNILKIKDIERLKNIEDIIEFNVNIVDNLSPITKVVANIFTLDSKKIKEFNKLKLYLEYDIICNVEDKAGNTSIKHNNFKIYYSPQEDKKPLEEKKDIEKTQLETTTEFKIDKAQVYKDKRGIIIVYPTDDLFINKSFNINPNMYDSLKFLANIIKTKFPNKKISIEGHTDSVGPEKENEIKSSNYAWALYSYFVKNLNFDRNLIQAKGWGEKKPIDSNKNLIGRKRNRRVEIINFE